MFKWLTAGALEGHAFEVFVFDKSYGVLNRENRLVFQSSSRIAYDYFKFNIEGLTLHLRV